ncbi:MAG: D-aminoacyl-tRNA deacylase [Synechococcales bacterium]|nr:D-aminoacyl-tRNA deacylase [Synechococcales bacterium]
MPQGSMLKHGHLTEILMRVVVQRVTASSVTVDGVIVGQIGAGLNLLVGIAPTDTEAELDWMANKVLSLRLFPTENGAWDRSILEIGGELLVVSQFTLYGDCRKGRRPSFDGAAAPGQAVALFDSFVEKLQTSGLTVATGQFGATMQVAIANEGPVTLLLEREAS